MQTVPLQHSRFWPRGAGVVAPDFQKKYIHVKLLQVAFGCGRVQEQKRGMMFALLRLLVKLLPLLRLLIFSESPVSAPAFMKGSYNHTALLHGPSLVDLSAVYCLKLG